MNTAPPSAALDLSPGALLALRKAAGLVLQVHAGRVWVTRSSCLDDLFVGAGGHATLTGTRIVIQCDSAEPARIELRASGAAAVRAMGAAAACDLQRGAGRRLWRAPRSRCAAT